jgi:protein TonB
MIDKKQNPHKNELKSLLLSAFIHTSLIGAVLLYEQPVQEVASNEKKVSLDLMTYELPKQVVKKEKTIKPKKEKVEPAKKIKKVVKKKPKIQKPIVTEKKNTKFVRPVQKLKKEEKSQIKPPSKEKEEVTKKSVQPQKVKEPLQKAQTKQKESQREIFVKTNFKIIRDMVFYHLRYPSTARRMGWQGVVKLQLTISKEGELLSVKILETSKKNILDKAALKAALRIKDKKLPKPTIKTSIVLPIAFLLK